MSQADLPLTFLVGGALVSVAGVLYFQLTSRTKRAEDQVDKHLASITTIAPALDGIKERLDRIEALLRAKS